ncbi:VOC family protein [Roseivirga sp. BDSF3-8]|uniref:VOC family protein n=1 Tax=Roseivirga sp. BDSF3-8 TaxID=3241598 RepID=UPI003531B04A
MSETPYYPAITPYLIIENAAGLLDFLQEVFGAEARSVQHREDGRTIMHAEVTIGEGLVMIADSTEEFPESPAVLYVYLDEVDKYYKTALKAGAKSLEEPNNQEYGHRRAAFADKHKNHWWIASPIQAK